MQNSSHQISILGLLGLITFAGVAVLVFKWTADNWSFGVQAIILTPILLLYAFSWSILVLLAPALVAVFPGISGAPVIRWCLAVAVGAAECLFVILWIQTESLVVLVGLSLLFSGIWLGASMVLREYSEML